MKLEDKLNQGRQYRRAGDFFMPETKRIESDFYVEGYATTWEPYVLYTTVDGEEIREQFLPEAFNMTDIEDVIVQYDHEGRVMARRSNGSLVMEFDDRGLFVAIDLGRTELARQVYDEVKTQMTTKMSWGFLPGDYEYDKETRTIIHKSIRKIFDVSVVSLPANSNTEIHAREFANGAICKFTEEFRRREDLIKQIQIQCLIGGQIDG